MDYLKKNYSELENITSKKGIYSLNDVQYFIKKYYQTNWNLITEELETKFNMRMSQSSKTLNKFLGFNV
jgi:hypothetical protein